MLLFVFSLSAQTIATFDNYKKAKDAYYVLKDSFPSKNFVIIKSDGKYIVKIDEKDIARYQKTLRYKKHTLDTKKVIALYRKKDIHGLYKLLSQFDIETITDRKVLFIYGVVDMQLQKYDEAIEIFEKLLQKDKSKRLRLELARSYFYNQDYEKSKKLFVALQKEKLPSSVQKKIEKFLVKITKYEKVHTFHGSVYVGAGYDDNALNNTYLGTIRYGDLILDNNTTQQSESFHKEILSFSYAYKLDKRQNVGLLASLYNNDYFELSNIDVTLYSLGVLYNLKQQNNLFKANMKYDLMYYAHERYLNIYSLTLHAEHRVKKSFSLYAALNGVDKNYVKSENSAQDARMYSANIGVKKVSKKYLFHTKATFSQQKKKRGDRVDIDKTSYGLFGMYSYKEKVYELGVSLNYLASDYSDVDPFLGKRDDTFYDVSLFAKYKIKAKLFVDLKYENIRNDSSVDVYVYKKQLVNIGMTYLF